MSAVVPEEAHPVAKGRVGVRLGLTAAQLVVWVLTLLGFGAAAIWQASMVNGSEKAVTIGARSEAPQHEEITMSRGQTLKLRLISLDTWRIIVGVAATLTVTR